MVYVKEITKIKSFAKNEFIKKIQWKWFLIGRHLDIKEKPLSKDFE